ncbi:MAG: M28 family peptidase [Vicinamibacterales bacterium]
MKARRFVLVSTLVMATAGLAARQVSGPGVSAIRTEDLKRWLGYLASDALEGRGNGSEGLGLAAAYVANELEKLGVQPGGDNGTWFQRVKVLGIRSTNRSTLTVEVNGKARTFKNGEGIRFPANSGGKRTVTIDQVEFVGYGLNAPAVEHNDYAGRDVKGKAVVWFGAGGPKGLDQQQARRILSGRNRYATEQAFAAAVIGSAAAGPQPGAGRGAAAPPAGGRGAAPGAPAAAGAGAGAGAGRGQAASTPVDFTTVQRLDAAIAPSVTVDADAADDFYGFLFAGSPTSWADIKAKAAAQEPLPVLTLPGVKLTFNIDADYEVLQTQFTRNVVGIVPGTDPKLRETYVLLGAHLDHTGYQQGVTQQEDRIFNGADDDGSGSAALLAIAKAFVQGPKPRRSIRLVWFTGEERGLWGSRYDADFGVDPALAVAQLNIDMIGRNAGDRAEMANTVYVIGSDRISTELHNINVEANDSLPKPLTLNYEYNDPADTENLYFRSDHYSYAAKGIPIVFYTTGLHPDYHRVTDSIEKIEWEKFTRITGLVYETARRLAMSDRAPARDNKGPRAGKGTTGKIGS